MLIVDDILLSPFRLVFWLGRTIHGAIEEERLNEAEAITEALRELYMMLETGQISEETFDAQEAELLDRLDALRQTRDG